MSYNRDYYLKNKSKYIERSKKWQKDNHEKYLESEKKRYLKRKKYLQSYRKTSKGIYLGLKKGAKDRNLQFEIKFEEFLSITSNPCIYCNEINFVSLDRIDNKIGYIISNVSSCCSRCNYMKGTMTKKQFLDHCAKIVSISC